jgi:excisionase family DNA binding protein
MKALIHTSLESEGTNGQAQGRAQSFLDSNQAAALLRISPKTLLRWAREGLVPAHPLSGNKRRIWRFLEAELDAWALSRVHSTRDWCQNSGEK